MKATLPLLLTFLLCFTFQGLYAQLILNEIHADPASDLPGDANGDGTRAFLEDEFLEFVNLGPDYIDLSNYTYRDGERIRETFPDGFRLGPGEVLLLFGLPSPSGPLDPANFGGATILHVDDTGDGLSLTNGGDTVRIYDPEGNIFFDAEYGDLAGNDQSITLSPDLEGSEYFLHRDVAADSARWSPGLTTDNRILSFPLLLNEIHADPASDSPGDANGDGTRSNIDDEFLEFINVSNQVIDLSGFQFLDASEPRHTFPEGTVVFPGQPLVVFGGGVPTGDFGGAVVQVSSSGNLSLTNGGDQINLRSPSGDTIFTFTFGNASIDQSLTRSPDISGALDSLTAHSDAAGDTLNLWSPGTQIDGTPFEFDASGIPTVVEFATTEVNVFEDAGTVDVLLRISGANPDTATQVEVRIIGGTGATIDISNFAASYNLEFPAGSSEPQMFSLDITDDLDPEGPETFIYAISTISGPASAAIGTQDTFTLEIAASDLSFPLLVNEIHADPKPGLEGDANGDGERVFQDDEFIEFINIGDEPLDLSGFFYEDARGITFHVFPEGTIVNPGTVLLLFGRPVAASILPENFCNAQIQFASESSIGEGEGLSLTNGGDVVTLSDSTGQVVVLEAYGEEGGQDQSINRMMDGQRVDFELHTVLAGGDTTNLYSPGCMINGMDFTVNVRELLPETAASIFPNPTTGLINLRLDTELELEALNILDMSGRILRRFQPFQQYDLSSLPDGFYLVELQTGAGRVLKKLILQR